MKRPQERGGPSDGSTRVAQCHEPLSRTSAPTEVTVVHVQWGVASRTPVQGRSRTRVWLLQTREADDAGVGVVRGSGLGQ
jgi:hypothetical protein